LRLLWWIPTLVLAAAGWAALDERAGIPAWQRLRGELLVVHSRIDVLGAEVDALRREAEALERDDFALERAIREDLGLALPGESIVRFAAEPRAGSAPR
jgi:cell division protein FtsB